jgi:hypothetical protein
MTTPARRPYSRHGYHALKVRVRLTGIGAVDGRTGAAQALQAWRRELLEHVGGEAASAPQRLLVDKVVNAELLIGHGMAYLLGRESLVNKRRHGFIPLVEQIQRLVDSQARLLGLLGLERKPPKPPDLSEYLERTYGQRAAEPAATEAKP